MWPEAAAAADAELRRLELLAVALGRRFWRHVIPGVLSGSWELQIGRLLPALEQIQLQAASVGASYGASSLASQGVYEAPAAFVDPRGFAGTAPDGRSLEGLLYSVVPGVKGFIANGMDPRAALRSGGALLDRNMRTLVSDTGRAASSVDIASRPRTG